VSYIYVHVRGVQSVRMVLMINRSERSRLETSLSTERVSI
jgi:hypothetical protein